jgi:hypothetical protein
MIAWFHRHTFDLAVFGGIIAFALAITGLLYLADTNRCRADMPRHLRYGRIASVGGLFSSETAYYLYYDGHKERTGAECVATIRVTETEYQRQLC